MSDGHNAFSKAAGSAENLSKSVLGTLALFLLLVYLVASVTLALARLTELNQTLLILFVILFPVIVLFVFYRLVTRHFGKIVNPDKIDKDVYAKVVLRAIEESYSEVERNSAANEKAEEDRNLVIREITDSDSESERQILHRIIDWYSPEWRQKRYLFRRASEEIGNAPEVLFADKQLLKEIIDVFRFLDHVSIAANRKVIQEGRIPSDFRMSAVRYFNRGRSWLKYLRDLRGDNSRYEDFERAATRWAESLEMTLSASTASHQ